MGMEICATIMENMMEAPKKLKIEILYDPAISLWVCIQKKWKWDLKEIPLFHIHCNIIYNSQDIETTKVSVCRCVNKEDTQ